MADLQVVAVITAKPGSEGLVREALSELVGPTREEDGCLEYSLYETSDSPGVFVTVETWREKADLDQHLASDHIAATFAKAGEALATQPAIHLLAPIDVHERD